MRQPEPERMTVWPARSPFVGALGSVSAGLAQLQIYFALLQRTAQCRVLAIADSARGVQRCPLNPQTRTQGKKR